MAQSQTEAKRFFVDRIIAQANADQIALSEAERYMLSWSESDPDFAVDLDMADRLTSEISDEDYEKKVRTLITRAFRADTAADSSARARWREASRVLRRGDHYIQIMLDQSVGGWLSRWWEFWRSRA